MSAAIWALANDSLTSWLVGLGMDQERGLLMAACLEVGMGAALATTAVNSAGAVRCGSLIAMIAVQIVPFLVRAAQAGPTPGLASRVDVGGWLLQPLGMLLLGALSATGGAAAGALLRRDVAGLWAVLSRHHLSAVPMAAVAGLVIVAAGAAATGVQIGPISALYSYGSGASARGAVLPVAAGGGSVGGASAAPASISRTDRLRPGSVERFDVAGHPVNVYLPGAYSTTRSHAFGVVYFLHGFPGGANDWIAGGQLVGVLDQLIASSQLPPLIAVMPDGNGQPSRDSEWGNTVRGDRIETWLVDQLIPQIDKRYRAIGARYRGVAGLSSGGFGALNLAARHPGVFSWAASYSGYGQARVDLFGDRSPANTPLITLPPLRAAQRAAIFIGAGIQDGRYLVDAQSLAAALQRVGWTQLQVSKVPGGHSWETWRPLAVGSLHWLGRLWGPDPGSAVGAGAAELRGPFGG
jgi:enterochelin esterase-like enzyme